MLKICKRPGLNSVTIHTSPWRVRCSQVWRTVCLHGYEHRRRIADEMACTGTQLKPPRSARSQAKRWTLTFYKNMRHRKAKRVLCYLAFHLQVVVVSFISSRDCSVILFPSSSVCQLFRFIATRGFRVVCPTSAFVYTNSQNDRCSQNFTNLSC